MIITLTINHMKNIIELKNLAKETIKNFEHLSIMVGEETIDEIFRLEEIYDKKPITNLDDLLSEIFNYISPEYFIFYQDAIDYLAKYDCSLFDSFQLLNEFYHDLNPLQISSATLANLLIYNYAVQEFSEFVQIMKRNCNLNSYLNS